MLQMSYSSLDKVPEPFRELYSEIDGEFRLQPIEGAVPESVVDDLFEQLEQAREDHKTTVRLLRAREKEVKESGADPVELANLIEQRAELKAKLAELQGAPDDGTDYVAVLESITVDSHESIERAKEAIDADADRARAKAFAGWSGESESPEAHELAVQDLVDSVVEIERTRLERKCDALAEHGEHLDARSESQRIQVDGMLIRSEIETKGKAAGLLPEALPDALALAETTLHVRYGRIVIDCNFRNPDGFIRNDTLAGWLRRCRKNRPHWFGAPSAESRRTLFPKETPGNG